jgi:hypothetical protein
LKLQLVDDWENVTKHNQVRHSVSLVDGAGGGEDESVSRARGLGTALTIQLVTLPRTPHVRQLLSQYKQYVEDTKQDRSAWVVPSAVPSSHVCSTDRSSRVSRSTSLLNEIISGITLYFDKALGNNLLYRFERAQYVEQTRRYGGGPAGAAGASAAPAGAGAGPGAGERSPHEGEVRKRAASEIYGAEHLLRLFGTSLCLPARMPHPSGVIRIWRARGHIATGH